MIEYLVAVCLGVLTGFFTGLFPGIHPNTVVFFSLPFYLNFQPGFHFFTAFVVGLSVSHTFLNFLPAILLGIPEAETALSALPGSQMAAEGRALSAFKSTVYGGSFALLVILFLTPVLFLFVESVYSNLQNLIPVVLAGIVTYIALSKDPCLPRVTTVLLSGGLGMIIFDSELNQNYVLVPVFAGLFAVPQILKFFRQNFELPDQKFDDSKPAGRLKGGLFGSIAGLIAGLLPGLGPAASSMFMAPFISSKKHFLASMGGVNTADIVVSFLAVYLIGNPRSGAAVAVNSLRDVGFQEIIFASSLGVFAAGISIIPSLLIAPKFIKLSTKLPFKPILILILVLLCMVSLFLMGFAGLLVLIVSSAVGYSSSIYESRILTMAVLVLPVITYLI